MLNIGPTNFSLRGMAATAKPNAAVITTDGSSGPADSAEPVGPWRPQARSGKAARLAGTLPQGRLGRNGSVPTFLPIYS